MKLNSIVETVKGKVFVVLLNGKRTLKRIQCENRREAEQQRKALLALARKQSAMTHDLFEG